MNRKLFLSLIIFITLSLLAGCKPADPICESQFYHGETFENTCTLRIEPNTDSLRLTMQASLSHGELDWQLMDPQGEVTWESSATSGHAVDTHWTTVKPAPGRWTLKIKSIEGVGEYHAPWTIK